MVRASKFGVSFINICTVLAFLEYVQCLLELSAENNTKSNEDIVSYTINKLFEILKLNEDDQNSSAKDYSDLHKYFVATSNQYENNLQDVTKLIIELSKDRSKSLVTANSFDDGSDIFENNDIVSNDDEYIVKYIDHFLSNIQEFKEQLYVQKNYEDLNNDILKYIIEDHGKTPNITKSNESDKSDENDFWEESGRRIFRGERTKIKHFPFMASIQIFNNFHCAGSIIKSDLIVTASSCLQLAWNNRFFRENPAFLSARVGSSFYNSGGEVIPILEIYFHPSYDPKTLRNNICVLRLIRHLKFRRKTRSIKKIDFDRNENRLSLNTPGITVVGWGAKKHSPVIGNPWENKISYAVLHIYPLSDCQDIYLKNYVTHKNFCAGFISRGGGACNRDVGGPGIVGGKLMGVISFGSPVCGMPDAPTVFTKLGYYADWIEQIMELEVPISKKRTTLEPYTDPFELPDSTPRPITTTFKIDPITGKTMTHIPISQIERQQNVENDDVKEILKMFFNSKEMEEYKDILKLNNSLGTYQDNTEKVVVAQNNEFTTEYYEAPEVYTKIENFSSEQSDSDKYTEYNVTKDHKTSEEDKSDDELVKLMKNVNLEGIVKEEIAKANVPSEESPNNETVLTLLYLSDDDKAANTKVSSAEVGSSEDVASDGMSIALDHFQDLTRAKNNNYIMPEDELYGLLSEMIGEEVDKINIDTL